MINFEYNMHLIQMISRERRGVLQLSLNLLKFWCKHLGTYTACFALVLTVNLCFYVCTRVFEFACECVCLSLRI